jgi:MoaA/NifB/PqqE/SkfB family radical SAM enzyme
MKRQFKHLELELSSKCNAACPQCPREDISIKKILAEEKNEITLENIINWFPKEFLENLNLISFKGSYSEPVIAKDFYPIVEYFIKNTTANIRIHTNGSLKKPDFWSKLAKLLRDRGMVTFGIDGLEDTHSIYRVNTSYTKILENAKEFIDNGGKARWQFIIFKYNEHQIEIAKKIATEMKFNSFSLIASPRFESSESFEINKKGNLIEKSDNYDAPTWDVIHENSKKAKTVDCKSDMTGWLLVDWNGEIFPCCWSQIWKRGIKSMHIDSKIWYKKVVKEENSTNLHNNSLENIIEKLEYFYNSLNKKFIPGICAGFCGNNELTKYNKFDIL